VKRRVVDREMEGHTAVSEDRHHTAEVEAAEEVDRVQGEHRRLEHQGVAEHHTVAGAGSCPGTC